MKKLPLLLFVLILVSCGTDSINQLDNGKRIGTWMAYPNKANWVGAKAIPSTASMVEGDRDSIIYLQGPKHVSLVLKSHPKYQYMNITYIDSTILTRSYNKYAIRIQYIFKGKGSSFAYGHDSFPNSKYFKCDLNINYFDCSLTGTDTQNIIFMYKDLDTDTPKKTVRTIVLNTIGLIPTLKYIQGCN